VIAGAFTGLSADAGSLFLLVVYPGISARYLMEMVFFFSSVDLSGWIVPPLPFFLFLLASIFSVVFLPLPLPLLACVVDLGLSSRG